MQKQTPVPSHVTPQTEALATHHDFDAYSRQPVGFYFCQSGFAPEAHKPLMVWATDRHAEAMAVWVPETDDPQPEPLPVACLGLNPWGRQEWRIDLSRIDGPATGRVRIDFGVVQGESPPIAVRADSYARLMRKAAAHYHYKRCGVTCHRNDGTLYSLEQEDFGRITGHVPVHGGWHDAHDDNKWLPLVWMPLYGLLKAHETFARMGPDGAFDRDYCLDEAQWEIEWLLRMQKPDGTFYHAVWEWSPREIEGRQCLKVWSPPPYDDLCDDRRALVDCWGQGVAERLIDARTVKTPSSAPKYFACVAHNLLHFARLAGRTATLAPLAARCREAAQRTLRLFEAGMEIPPFQRLEVDALRALCALESYRAQGDAAALRDCEARIDAMLARQQPQGHFHAAAECRALEWYPEEAGDERVLVDYPFGYLSALTEYLETSRSTGTDFTLVPRVEAALARFADLLSGFCRKTGFHQMVEPRLDGDPQIILTTDKTGHGYNSLILAAGVVLAAAGRLLDEPEWTRLAECQLYWVLGYNPRFMSFMNDEGIRHAGAYGGKFDSETGIYHHMAFYRHRRDMRWGVTTGIYAEPGTDLPLCGRSIEGHYDSKAQETWLNCNGWFLRLLTELAETLNL